VHKWNAALQGPEKCARHKNKLGRPWVGDLFEGFFLTRAIVVYASPKAGLETHYSKAYCALLLLNPAGPHFICPQTWLQFRVQHRFLQILVYNTLLTAPGSWELFLICQIYPTLLLQIVHINPQTTQLGLCYAYLLDSNTNCKRTTWNPVKFKCDFFH